MDRSEQLHDEIDTLEEEVERCGAAAAQLIRERLRDLLRETNDPLLAMSLVAVELEDKVVTDQTTEAFVLHAELAQRRAR